MGESRGVKLKAKLPALLMAAAVNLFCCSCSSKTAVYKSIINKKAFFGPLIDDNQSLVSS
jgi:hypothetical protein